MRCCPGGLALWCCHEREPWATPRAFRNGHGKRHWLVLAGLMSSIVVSFVERGHSVMVTSYRRVAWGLKGSSPVVPLPACCSELSDRQRELLEELREEEDRLSGKGARSGGKGGGSDYGSDSEFPKGDGDEEYSERHGTWGQYLQEAFDRLKSHLARKKNASSS